VKDCEEMEGVRGREYRGRKSFKHSKKVPLHVKGGGHLKNQKEKGYSMKA